MAQLTMLGSPWDSLLSHLNRIVSLIRLRRREFFGPSCMRSRAVGLSSSICWCRLSEADSIVSQTRLLLMQGKAAA